VCSVPEQGVSGMTSSVGNKETYRCSIDGVASCGCSDTGSISISSSFVSEPITGTRPEVEVEEEVEKQVEEALDEEEDESRTTQCERSCPKFWRC
jgi:hypothetical protein